METQLVTSDTLVTWRDSHGADMRASLLRLTRHSAAMEIYNPSVIIRLSDVLDSFRISASTGVVYSGRALVSNIVNAGAVVVCEVKLEDTGLNLIGSSVPLANGAGAQAQFESFLGSWQSQCRVRSDFKEVIGDMQTFLADLNIWLDQMELQIRSSPSADRSRLEREVIDSLGGSVTSVIDTFIERFEEIAAALGPELEPVHRTYLRRQLHPFLLCSPFAHRAFYKPLGFAGDYELVDMMLRPPYEGSTLFSKIINFWLLSQAPARAHRNRVDYLCRRLLEESVRVRFRGRAYRVFNLGCGPATEVQRFLAEQPISAGAQISLLDFNDETLSHVKSNLEALTRTHQRSTQISLIKRSVQQLLKEAAKPTIRTPESQYDFVYCAGLFDYLSDPVCKRLLNILYEILAPGGLLLATNVSDAMNSSRPFRYSMEYILDWHLITRNGPELSRLAPDRAGQENCRVNSEECGINVFIEVRKASNA